jgi:uncharacterized phage protein (TIGR02218 family)
MSFDVREISQDDGEPQELYLFMRGTTEIPYTSGAFPINLGLTTYEPLAGLSRSSVKRGQERSRNQLTVDVPRDAEIVEQFFGVPDQAAVWLHIYKIHEGESDYRIMWQGRVRSVDFKGEKATMTLDDIKASTKKQGLRHLFQGQCNNFTFDENCGLSEDDFRHDDQVTLTVDGSVLTVDNAEAAGYFIAGQVRRSNGERRMVTEDTKVVSTHTLTLLQAFEGLEPGELVRLIGGACRHTFATCQAVNNEENYGGYPLVPRKNPFRSIT